MQGLGLPVSPVDVLAHNDDPIWIRNIADDGSSVIAVEVWTLYGEDFSVVPVESPFDPVDRETVGPFDVVVDYDSSGILKWFKYLLCDVKEAS